MSCPCYVPVNRVDYTKPTILLYKTQNNLTYKKKKKERRGRYERPEGSQRKKQKVVERQNREHKKITNASPSTYKNYKLHPDTLDL